jgi:hypothetical protein
LIFTIGEPPNGQISIASVLNRNECAFSCSECTSVQKEPHFSSHDIGAKVCFFRDAAFGQGRVLLQDIEHFPIRLVQGSTQRLIQARVIQFEHWAIENQLVPVVGG